MTWRYRVAHQLNKLPGMCWAKLVMWVEFSKVHPLSDIRQDEMCRSDALRCGYCYCGAIRHKPTTKEATP